MRSAQTWARVDPNQTVTVKMTTTITAESSRMAGNMPSRLNGGHRSQSASIDVRLSQLWDCQLSTARARRERALRDVLDTLEVALALGDTPRLEHYLNLFDATLAGHPELPKLDAIHAARRADTYEDVLEAAFLEHPCKQTARAWFDALGKEGRSNEPAMAKLRTDWSL